MLLVYFTEQSVTDVKTEGDSDASDTVAPSVAPLRHDWKPFQCPVCCKRFKYKGSLYIHEKSHGEARTYRCATCSKRFTTEGRLLRHQSTHAEDRQGLTSVSENGPAGRARVDVVKRFLHTEHLYGRSPVWILICLLRVLGCVNFFSQRTHCNDRSPACARLCCFSER